MFFRSYILLVHLNNNKLYISRSKNQKDEIWIAEKPPFTPGRSRTLVQGAEVVTPCLSQTSTSLQRSPGVNEGYGYARGRNPTRSALEQKIFAALEEAKHCICFCVRHGRDRCSDRNAAPGDEVITGDDLYGGCLQGCLPRCFARSAGIRVPLLSI
jgi:cystathionine beta-lyase/cystathionine gamma-synthase